MTTQTEAGLAELQGYCVEQRAKLAELFAAHEAHDKALFPGKPRFTSQHWKDCCQLVREYRAGAITSESRVAGGSWFAEFWRGEVGSKWPPIRPYVRNYFARTWDKPEGLVWTLPAAVVVGGVASRAIHSKPGKAVLRMTVHAAIFRLVLAPLFRR